MFENRITPLQRLRKRSPNIYSILISIAFILYLRGLLGMMDLLIFPGDKFLSYSVSIVLGLLFLFLNDFKLKEIERE
jgi:hypothetical protein